MKRKLTNRLLGDLRKSEGPFKDLFELGKPFEVVDTEISGFLLRIQPSGVMAYYLSYYNKQGKRKRYQIGTTKSVKLVRARDIAEDKAADVTKGVDIAAEKKRERAEGQRIKTLGDYIEKEYTDWLMTHRRSAKDTLRRLKTCFGDWYDKDMLEITPWIVEKWQSQQKKKGKAPQSINRDIGALKPVFSKAKEDKKIAFNPLQDLKMMDAPDSERVRYLLKGEEKRLRKTLHDRDNQIKAKRKSANAWRKLRGYPLYSDLSNYQYPNPITPMILLTLNTGVRQSQLFRLKVDDLNFREKVMTVTTYKGAKTRFIKIPLNSEAIEVLREWMKIWKKLYRNDQNLVFPNPKTGEETTTIKTVWRGILEKAKIKGFWWRDMRHHAASWLLMAGVPLEIIQQILGHRDIRTTQRYAHIGDEYKQNAVEKLVNRD